MNEKKSCATCAFATLNNGGPTLVCRFNPPTVFLEIMQGTTALGQTQIAPQDFTVWPTVRESHWCGKWEDSGTNLVEAANTLKPVEEQKRILS